jgi:hypothetical protein
MELYFHLIFSGGPTSLPGNFISTLLFSCGLNSLPRCSSTLEWSSFDFLEYSSSLRKVVQEGIPPTATKTSTRSSLFSESFYCSIYFPKELLSQVEILVSSFSGCTALMDVGLMLTLLALLEYLDP